MKKPRAESRFLFYAGKGGVGKTTCAAARAIAEAERGASVLVVSTDPAQSLGDVLALSLSARPVGVRLPRSARGTLSAVKLDAKRAFARWIDGHRAALAAIVEHGTWLDRGDIDSLLDLSVPGVDELVALSEIGRLTSGTAAADYDVVVVDTAPTGHTLRLLAAPDAVLALAGVLDSLEEEQRIIRHQLAGVSRVDAADRLISLVEAQAAEARALLQGGSTLFHWVTHPEPMSISESDDGIAALSRSRIRVAEIIVNRATPPGPPCAICDRRRLDERAAIERIRRRFGRGRVVRVVPAARREPRGIAALTAIGRLLVGPPAADVQNPNSNRRSAVIVAASTNRPVGDGPLKIFEGARLIFFGGKGGVGKTTCAAAAALRLAGGRPARDVLLLSTDPAHSLADAFGQPVGNRPVRLARGPSNLHVREIDARSVFAAHRARLQAAFDEIAGTVGAGAGADRQAHQLMDLAPPGIDELFALVEISRLVEQSRDIVIVVDTAPTGHAVRLLEMPDAARDWVQVLMRVLLKYRSVVHPGKLAQELVDLSKSIRALQALLHNPQAARFMIVTRAADVPLAETARLSKDLRRLRLATPAIIVNALTMKPGECARCRFVAAAERRVVRSLARICRRQCAIIQTPLTAPPPHGVGGLGRWARTWIA